MSGISPLSDHSGAIRRCGICGGRYLDYPSGVDAHRIVMEHTPQPAKETRQA